MLRIASHGLRTDNRVFITFDDGPNPYFTEQVLKILSAFQIKATFFMMGARVQQYPELLCAVKEAGHIIGNHTYSHNLPDFEKCEQLLNQNGIQSQFVRPPFFEPKYCIDENFFRNRTVILGDARTYDYTGISAEEILANCKNNVQNGSVLTFHDGSDQPHEMSDRPREMVKALPFIIDFLSKDYKISLLDNVLLDFNQDVA